MWSDFKKFILRGNMVDLAVAFVVGAAFSGLVQSLVKDLLTPLIAAFGSKENFSQYYFTLHKSKFFYGDFLNSLIAFLLIAVVVFFFVVQPINKLVALANRNKTSSEPSEKKCSECLSSIPKAAARCAYCGIKQPV